MTQTAESSKITPAQMTVREKLGTLEHTAQPAGHSTGGRVREILAGPQLSLYEPFPDSSACL